LTISQLIITWPVSCDLHMLRRLNCILVEFLLQDSSQVIQNYLCMTTHQKLYVIRYTGCALHIFHLLLCGACSCMFAYFVYCATVVIG